MTMTTRTLRTAFFLFLLLALPAQAGVNQWTPFGPGGGFLDDFGIVPASSNAPAAIYTHADGGVFRSLDGGASWSWQGRSFYGPVAVDSEEPATLYTVDNYTGQAYRSVNGGAVWALLPDKPGGAVSTTLDRIRALDGVVYIAGSQGLFTSLDRGETWNRTPVGGSFSSLAVVPSQPLVAYAGMAGSAWKTSDGGLHWSQIFQRGAGSPAILAVSPVRPGRVYLSIGGEMHRSDDGGVVWQKVGEIGDVFALTVDSAETLYVAGRNGVRISTDLGATWRRTLDVPYILGPSEVVGVTMDPDRPGVAYAVARTQGLFRSLDGGLTWSALPRNGLGFPVAYLLERNPRSPNVYYMSRGTWADPLIQSTDGGRTWTTLSTLPEMHDFAFDPTRPELVYAAGEGLFRSADRGRTWMHLEMPDGLFALNQVVARGDTLVVGSFRGVYRSLDLGSTWEPILAGDVVRLIPDAKDPALLYVVCAEADYWPERSTTVFRSRDGGVSWRRILTGAQGFVADSVQRGRLYAIQGTTVLSSRDRGNTWQAMGTVPAPVRPLAAGSGRSGVLLAGTHSTSGVIFSRDGGRTWAPMNVGLAKMRLTFAEQLVADPSVPGRFFTLPENGGVLEIMIP